MSRMTEEQFLGAHLRTVLDGEAPEPRIERLAGDVSSRRYYRACFDRPVQFSDQVTHPSLNATMGGSVFEGGGTPPVTSMVLTVYPEAFDTKLTARESLLNDFNKNTDILLTYANSPLAQLEQTSFLREHGFPVPSVFYIKEKLELSGGATSVGLVIFEDFGDERLLERLTAGAPAERQKWYLRAVELIARLHNVTLEAQARPLVGSFLAFDEKKLMWELNYFLKHYFNSYKSHQLPASILAEIELELVPLCQALADSPRVLCHRDYHARNLMVQGEALYLIDYQDARLGPTTYDLVSLLLDPYAPTAGLDIKALLECYRMARGSSHPAVPSEDELALEWTRMAAQRLLKAAGTYAFMVGVRGVSSFEGYLKPTVAQARSCLSALGGFDRLCEVLE